MEGEVKAVEDFESFILCGGLAFGGLAAVCLEESANLVLDACVLEMQFSEATDGTKDADERIKFEGAKV